MERIQDFPNYLIDENGNVYREKSMRKLKQTYSQGYAYVQLHNHGVTKRCRVHRLVAKAFIPNPNDFPCVNHKDEIKTNNNVNNLEWCTYQYNNNYGEISPVTRMIEARKRALIQMTLDGVMIAEFESSHDAKRKTGINQAHISECCLGKRHTASGYRWMFKPSTY